MRPPRACSLKQAASIRDLISTVEEMEQKQKMAAAEGDDADIFAYYAETPLIAVNLFHMRNGHIVDRREFFWEDQIDWNPAGILRGALEAGLSESAVYSRTDSRAGRSSRIWKIWKSTCRKSGAGRLRSTHLSAGRKKRCSLWRRQTLSTASTRDFV